MYEVCLQHSRQNFIPYCINLACPQLISTYWLQSFWNGFYRSMLDHEGKGLGMWVAFLLVTAAFTDGLDQRVEQSWLHAFIVLGCYMVCDHADLLQWGEGKQHIIGTAGLPNLGFDFKKRISWCLQPSSVSTS